MKVVIAGDFCDRMRVKEIVSSTSDQSSSVLRNVTSHADYSIVNFESPLVIDKGQPIEKCGGNLSASVDSIGFIKRSGFDCVTLANNHILDQGEQCLFDTVNQFESIGIDTVGVGSNIETASHVLYKKIKGKVLAVINCCEHEFSIASISSAGANPVSSVSQYYSIREARKKADYVLLIVHGGVEHFRYPTLRMKQLYRFFIDVGADAVVNHHQHCYSGFEVYNGKPIFYGLGNLIFDHVSNRNSFWNLGYMVSIDFNDVSPNYELVPYEQCNDIAGIKLLLNGDKDKFLNDIQIINQVISDDCKLLKVYQEFNLHNSEIYKIALSPYNSRLAKALHKRGLLPSFITKRKVNLLLDVLLCESHFDRMINYLKTL